MQETQADPDAQATELATMLGIGKDTAQRRLNIMASAFILFLQFTCLSLRSFLRHRVAPAISALTNGPLGPGKSGQLSGQLSNAARKVTIEQARQDVQANVSAGVAICNLEYAERWGVDEGRASRWISQFVREGHAQREWRGQRKVLVRKGLRALNGASGRATG
jgi:hypothetical protein